MEFQYNFCYCSIQTEWALNFLKESFNTTFVTVLYSGMYEALKIVRFQYNFCYCSINLGNYKIVDFFGFQYNFCYCSMIIVRLLLTFRTVSIQLLLLFYGESQELTWKLYWFQYNFCYCSIKSGKTFNAFLVVFQYNFCYCSINQELTTYTGLYSFQYNFCYCSIRIFTGFLFYYITRYPLKIKIF